MYTPTREELRDLLTSAYEATGRREIAPHVYNYHRKKGWPTCYDLLKQMGITPDCDAWYKLQADVMKEGKRGVAEAIKLIELEVRYMEEFIVEAKKEKNPDTSLVVYSMGDINGLRKALKALRRQTW